MYILYSNFELNLKSWTKNKLRKTGGVKLTPFECYKSRFYSYALFGLLDEWIKRGFHESIEQMSENVKKICEQIK